MPSSRNRLITALWLKARSRLGLRFGRFALAAVAALAANEVALAVCLGPLGISAAGPR